MSCHGLSKYSILTVILTCRSALVPYYLSKGFVIVETEVVGVDNIPMSVNNQINSSDLNQDESLLTLKSYLLSIFNTLNKIIIARYLYEEYVSKFYDDRHVYFYSV